ncbi:hypothetical protein DSO57_1036309 [Entomophthora muscae]|uniref:Uncharacterized protein n=1 Tax=Entomophthora muscae TaxID=34485 RepID=A0ACC2TA85_9FUNG|nr:hypothetical protein DSO57_1036309 [Entomophthora muscae]
MSRAYMSCKVATSDLPTNKLQVFLAHSANLGNPLPQPLLSAQCHASAWLFGKLGQTAS